VEARERRLPQKRQRARPPEASGNVYGTLPEIIRDTYHCEDTYVQSNDSVCSPAATSERESEWLNDVTERYDADDARALPFHWPHSGSTTIDLGCGLGQDARHLAWRGGHRVLAVDASPSAIRRAVGSTKRDSRGFDLGKVQFLSYDALALPRPKILIDFVFDDSIYCALRHRYLARLYLLWRRILTSGHTVMLVQCWTEERLAGEEDHGPVRISWSEMRADFEPVLNVLHSHRCEKNMGGPAWCFWLGLKERRDIKELTQERLAQHRAASSGDMDALTGIPRSTSWRALPTLRCVAVAAGHQEAAAYLAECQRKGSPRNRTLQEEVNQLWDSRIQEL